MNDLSTTKNKIEIETEFPISLLELAVDVWKRESSTGIIDLLSNKPDTANRKVKSLIRKIIREEKADVKVKKAFFSFYDSTNVTHGTAYFKVKLCGTEEELKKIAGEDKDFFYEWNEESGKNISAQNPL